MTGIKVTIVEVCLQKNEEGVLQELSLRFDKDENVLIVSQENDEIVLDVNDLSAVAKEGLKLLEQWNG